MPHTITAQFKAADTARAGVMRRARNAARLTHATMLPEEGTTQDEELARSFQGLGADGLSNLVSKLLIAIFPPNMPWFRFKPSVSIRTDPRITKEGMLKFEAYLYARELLILSQFDATKVRTKFRTTFEHTLGVGNSLTLLGGEFGDYWYKNFRLDNFVQKRGGDGEILWGITLEMKDPMELTDEDFERAKLKRKDFQDKLDPERAVKLYTRWARESMGKKSPWLIEQEINGQIIRTSEEPVNPYLALGYIELTGENWSRGFVEEKMGDLRSFDTSYKSILDWMAAASKLTLVLDPATAGEMTAKDLTLPSGRVINGAVVDGIVRGVAFLQTKMTADMSLVGTFADGIERRLGKQFLLETEAQRQAERVTATEVNRVARQLEGALGGIYSEIASEIQRPLLDRMTYQMERDGLMLPVPKGLEDAVDIEILTGLEAMGRQVELQKLASAFQMLSVSPEMLARISPERMMEAVFRGHNLDMAQYVKTEEEMQEERERQQQDAIQAVAAEQGIKTAGAVIEEGAKQQAAQPAQSVA